MHVVDDQPSPAPPRRPHRRVGIDLTTVSSVREAAAGPGGRRYLDRVYTPAELAATAADPAALAACFAAKEAMIKLLRPGPRDAVAWSDIDVRHEAPGAISVQLEGTAGALARRERLGTARGSASSAGCDLVMVVLMADAA